MPAHLCQLGCGGEEERDVCEEQLPHLDIMPDDIYGYSCSRAAVLDFLGVENENCAESRCHWRFYGWFSVRISSELHPWWTQLILADPSA